MIRENGFNDSILEAVDAIYAEWKAQGYDENSYFTHDLDYGPFRAIKANNRPKTMCVAAVAEVIVTGMTRLYHSNGDPTPFEKLPITSWQRGTASSIRAHIFMYGGLKSNGTAHALSRFGIGQVVAFNALKPGDFINFNRESGTGHACVFLGYLDAQGNETAAFDSTVAGFKYFSAQGKSSIDGGLGYRWAFFAGKGPVNLSGGRRMDRGVIFSNKPSLLCCGYMMHPSIWPAFVGLKPTGIGKTKKPALVADESPDHEQELPAPDLSRFDGVTSGDRQAVRKKRRKTASIMPERPLERSVDYRSFVGSLGIKVDLLPVGFPTRPGSQIQPTSITIHNTDNTSPGADAAAHNHYIRGADAVKRAVSWHFTVDDRAIFQHLPVNEWAYHAGQAANSSSIGIEICMNPEMNPVVAYDKAASLCAYLALELRISIRDGLKQHNDWTGKNCPRVLRSTLDGWPQFTGAVAARLKAVAALPGAPGTRAGQALRVSRKKPTQVVETILKKPSGIDIQTMASIDAHFTEHSAEESTVPCALAIPEIDPVPFAKSSFVTRYWPVVTTHPRATEVNTLTNGGSLGSQPGRRFLATRNHDSRYHVGVDLFCSQGNPVIAIEDGRIVGFYAFTDSPNPRTHALLVAHRDYVANYGEVSPNSLASLGLSVGSRVCAGQQIGTVGRLNMLHFETYAPGTKVNKKWYTNQKRPPVLRNPSQLLLDLAANGIRLSHKGIAYRIEPSEKVPPIEAIGFPKLVYDPSTIVVPSTSDWHRFEDGSREWRYDERGLSTREGKVVKVQRWDSDLSTMRRIVKLMGKEILVASTKHGINPALIMMTVATETHVYSAQGFTGPRTFRWEAHVANKDVKPPFDGDYSAGPMQTLGTTVRWLIRSYGKQYGLNYQSFDVAPVYRNRPVPPPPSHPLYEYSTNTDIGTAEIRVRSAKTQDDPILVAAAYNTGGLRSSHTSPWGICAYGDHLDRAAKWYGDACALLIEMGVF